MPDQNRASTPDELPWDLDLTVARPPATPSDPTVGAPARAHHPRGEFYRPELETRTQRLGRSVLVRVLAALVLVGGTASLVVLAVMR